MLWQFQTGAGMNSTASTFEHGGKQYVVAYSAGNVLIGSAKGDSVWLFALDGTLPPAKERDTEARPAAAPVAATASRGPTSGAQIFQQACLPCHGADGRGGHGGGAPLNKVSDLALVMQTVKEGRKNMPPFGAALSEEQIQAVSRFVATELFK
jgi:mono/diheme cytochrome c family protein